jgi:hypothetical protein
MPYSPEWLQQVWSHESTMSMHYFNAWGRMWKALPKRLTIDEILNIPPDEPYYGPIEIFLNGDPDGFLRYFGGKGACLSDEFITGTSVLLMPDASPEIRKMIVEDDDIRTSLSMWIFALFFSYSNLYPEKMESLGMDPLEKYLLLSHNAQFIYYNAFLAMAAWDKISRNYKRTARPNEERRLKTDDTFQKIIELYNRKVASNPRIEKMTINSQAILLKKWGVPAGIRTISKRLAEIRPSSPKNS